MSSLAKFRDLVPSPVFLSGTIIHPDFKNMQFQSTSQNHTNSKEEEVSSGSYHWTHQDSDTCPRVDTCLQSNIFSDNFYWTQAAPRFKSQTLDLNHHSKGEIIAQPLWWYNTCFDLFLWLKVDINQRLLYKIVAFFMRVWLLWHGYSKFFIFLFFKADPMLNWEIVFVFISG